MDHEISWKWIDAFFLLLLLFSLSWFLFFTNFTSNIKTDNLLKKFVVRCIYIIYTLQLDMASSGISHFNTGYWDEVNHEKTDDSNHYLIHIY